MERVDKKQNKTRVNCKYHCFFPDIYRSANFDFNPWNEPISMGIAKEERLGMIIVVANVVSSAVMEKYAYN